MWNSLHIQHLDWTVASVGAVQKGGQGWYWTGDQVSGPCAFWWSLGWNQRRGDPLKAKDRGMTWLDLHVRRIFLKTLWMESYNMNLEGSWGSRREGKGALTDSTGETVRLMKMWRNWNWGIQSWNLHRPLSNFSQSVLGDQRRPFILKRQWNLSRKLPSLRSRDPNALDLFPVRLLSSLKQVLQGNLQS